MNKKILVTYASRTDWTVGVAEAIGKTFEEKGAEVDVIPMREVKDLSTYQAVVAGSSINRAAWIPEAMQFIRVHRDELKRKPFATFQVCMTLAMRNGENYRPHVMTWLEPVRRLVRPIREGFFAGGLDISRIPSFADRLKFRISVLFGVWKEGDHRDWNAIRSWTLDTLKVL